MIHKSGILNGTRRYQTPLDRPTLLDNATEMEFTTSIAKCGRPGVYDSERAARYSFKFYDEDLLELQERAGPGGCITLEMLQELYRRVGKTKPWERS